VRRDRGGIDRSRRIRGPGERAAAQRGHRLCAAEAQHADLAVLAGGAFGRARAERLRRVIHHCHPARRAIASTSRTGSASLTPRSQIGREWRDIMKGTRVDGARFCR